MPEWTRHTPWKQGSLIPSHVLHELGILPSEDFVGFGVVISHDCDLANDNLVDEPHVELVLASAVQEANGNLENGKNPRRLHLSWKDEQDVLAHTLELSANGKRFVKKNELCGHSPEPGLIFCQKNHRILQGWLAARYKRQALPDSLQDRLNPVFGLLQKRGKSKARGIIGYWFSFDPQYELPPEEPYELEISIVYTVDEPSAFEHAQEIARHVQDKFHELVAKAGCGPVELSECEEVSEEAFTLRDMRMNIEYRVEHLSHRVYPNGAEVD